MENVIELQGAGVRCDHCPFVQRIPPETLIDWVDKPCPKCGIGPIITKADYQNYLQVLDNHSLINAAVAQLSDEQKNSIKDTGLIYNTLSSTNGVLTHRATINEHENN